MKRVIILLISAVIIFNTACSKFEENNKKNSVTTQEVKSETIIDWASSDKTIKTFQDDLNADGTNETIKIIDRKQCWEYGVKNTGILSIKKGSIEKEVVFRKNENMITGGFWNYIVDDFDRDGSKDIMIVIPDVGSSEASNYFYIYSYKRDLSVNFNQDYSVENLQPVFQKMQFKALNGGIYIKLDGKECSYKPEAKIDKRYNILIDPTPVMIIDDKKPSGIYILKNHNIKINVPYLIYNGNEKIGEVDVCFTVDDNFKLIQKSIAIYNIFFTGGFKKEKVGEWK